MVRVLVLTIVLSTVSWVNAQRYPLYANYTMASDVQPDNRTVKGFPYYYSKYFLAVEYAYDAETDLFYKYRTENYRVKLLSDAAIDEFNKVYIPTEDVYGLENLQARIIRKDTIIDVPPKIEEFQSKEKSEQYYYFPISGLSLGDELEILLTMKMESAFDGDQFHFQGEVPVYDMGFSFVTPNDSYFDFHAQNGLPSPVKVDTILQRNHWTIEMDYIPAFKTEYFIEYPNEVMKLDCSLEGEGLPGSNNYSPYDKYREFYNKSFNVDYKWKTRRKVKKLAERIGCDKGTDEERIRKIERYIKEDFVVVASEKMPHLDQILETESGNGISVIKLLMTLLQSQKIDFEYGFVSDRYETYFNPAIESAFFMEYYFFYFPSIDKYMAPLDYTSRLGFLDYKWIPNNGYYMHSKKSPKNVTIGSVRPLPSTRARDNIDSTIVHIQVNESLNDLDITVERHLFGYDAGEHQIYYNLYNRSRKKEVHRELLNFLNDRSEYKMSSIENVENKYAYIKPLVIKGEVVQLNSYLFEKAGTKTILKLGNVFGEYLDVRKLRKKKKDFVFANPFTTSTTIIIDFPREISISNEKSVPKASDYSIHDDIAISTSLEVSEKQIVFNKHEEYKKHRYSIAEKEKILPVFQLYNALNNMVLIVE